MNTENLTRLLHLYIADTITVDRAIAIAYRGDFYGLLKLHNIPREIWLLTLRANNISSSTDFDGRLEFLITVDSSILKN
jgi:hypothetical protein